MVARVALVTGGSRGIGAAISKALQQTGCKVLTALFLKAGFLGIMLFGLKWVGRRLHFLATCTVSLGTLIR